MFPRAATVTAGLTLFKAIAIMAAAFSLSHVATLAAALNLFEAATILVAKNLLSHAATVATGLAPSWAPRYTHLSGTKAASSVVSASSLAPCYTHSSKATTTSLAADAPPMAPSCTYVARTATASLANSHINRAGVGKPHVRASAILMATQLAAAGASSSRAPTTPLPSCRAAHSTVSRAHPPTAIQQEFISA